MKLVPQVAAVAAIAVLLSSCAAASEPKASSSASASTTASATATSVSPTPEAAPKPSRPPRGACYSLPFKAAAAPTTDADPLPCRKDHNALTFHVGQLDSVVDGHLLAVDSEHVQQKVASECPRRLGDFVGASPGQLRLSMLRTIWFSPSLKAASDGENWYRCDVIAVAGESKLAPLGRTMKGALSAEEGRTRYGVCGTAQPGEPDFKRVICSRPHAWRAIAAYDIAGTSYPGVESMRDAGSSRCKSAAKDRAEDALDFEWALDWPTKKQWSAGQRWGLCWAPDA